MGLPVGGVVGATVGQWIVGTGASVGCFVMMGTYVGMGMGVTVGKIEGKGSLNES